MIQHKSWVSNPGFHDEGRQGNRSVFNQSCDGGFLGEQDDGGAFEVGGNVTQLQRSLEDLCEDQSEVSRCRFLCSYAGRGHILSSWSHHYLLLLKGLVHTPYSQILIACRVPWLS